MSLTTLSHLASAYPALTHYIHFLPLGEWVYMLKSEISCWEWDHLKVRKKREKKLPTPAYKHSINLKMRSQNSFTKASSLRFAVQRYVTVALLFIRSVNELSQDPCCDNNPLFWLLAIHRLSHGAFDSSLSTNRGHVLDLSQVNWVALLTSPSPTCVCWTGHFIFFTPAGHLH